MATRTLLLLSLATAAAAGAGACSSHELMPPPAPDRLTSPRSYLIRGQFRPSPAGSDVPTYVSAPNEQELVLRVDPAARTALLGQAGEAVGFGLATDDGVAFRATESISIRLPSASCQSRLTYADFRFSAGLDSIAGTAAGMAYIDEGDVSLQVVAVFDFTGVPDGVGPSLVGGGSGVDPLAQLFLAASEPVPSDAMARLFTPVQTVGLETSVPVAEAAVGFRKPDVALLYDTAYQIVVDHWIDLAGNLGGPTGAIVTAAAPPVAAQTGFEGAGETLDGAAIVDGSVFPPISGQRSAILGPIGPQPAFAGTRTTVRLSVSPGDRVVRLSIRAFSPFFVAAGAQRALMRLAVPGGAITGVPLPTVDPLDTEQTLPTGVMIHLGAVHQIEAALPAGATDEVVFDFDTFPPLGYCTSPLAIASYQIDDLRVE